MTESAIEVPETVESAIEAPETVESEIAETESDDSTEDAAAEETAAEESASTTSTIEESNGEESDVLIGNGKDNDIEIRRLDITLRSGAAKVEDTEDLTYVWKATNSAADHRYTFRINYAVSGTFEFAPGTVRITIPKSILRNRNGKLSDYYDLSVPMYDDPEITSATKYVAKEEGDNIVIYNNAEVAAGENGFIEVSYLTSERTLEYADYDAANSLSDAFSASMYIEQNGYTDQKQTDNIYVGMDTGARVTSTDKRYPQRRYSSWQPSWGNLVKPENSDDYYYHVWEIRSYIGDITQPYNFSLEDDFDNIDGEVVGFKMQGETIYRSTSLVPTIRPISTSLSAERYDYVLTKHLKSTYQDLTQYEIKNYVTAIVDPIDQVDEDTYAYSSKLWEYIKPTFSKPTGRFMLWKWGKYISTSDGGHYKNRSYDSEDIESFALTDFNKGIIDRISDLEYETEMIGYQWPWTLDQSSGITAWQNPDNYGKIPVETVIYDNEWYLNTVENETYTYDTSKKLTKDDYQLDKITFREYIMDAEYDRETESFTQVKPVYQDDDKIEFYGEFDGEWKLAATYYLKSETYKTTEYAKSAENKTVTFKDNCTGWKAIYSNPYFRNDVYINPFVSLKDSDFVKNTVKDKEKVNLLNVMHSDVYVYGRTTPLVSFDESGNDWIMGITPDGHIKKAVTNYKNNKAKKIYTISWETSAYEDYINADKKRIMTEQSSGTFYDLLPLGGELSEQSIRVYGDGNEINSSAYTYEVKKNYQNSGRDLLVISISDPANQYKAAYDTTHSWDNIQDYGEDTINHVAYETGNVTIGDGTPDNGGNSGVEEFVNLNEETSDTEGEKFLYTYNRHIIDLITAANLGLYKKVKDQSDIDYSYKTTTHNGSNYSYNIRFATDDEIRGKDLILFDSLENYITSDDDGNKSSDWRGTLESVDVTQPTELGSAPVIYYSTVEKLDLEKHHDLTDTSIWTVAEKFGDISKAKAVAIDMRKTASGEDFILDYDTAVNVTLHMRAPDSVQKVDGQIKYIAYNNIYLNNTVIARNGDTETNLIHQDYTQIEYRAVGDLLLTKANAKDHTDTISDMQFTLSGISLYGTQVYETRTSDSKGYFSFTGIEEGDYALQETSESDDWLADHEVRNVHVHSDGSVTIDELTEENGRYVFENKERIHGDLSFYKVSTPDTEDNRVFINGATFLLTGTSDYGTEITMVGESKLGGAVAFTNLEKGTYELTEVKSGEGFVRSNEKWEVTVDANGGVSISSGAVLEGTRGELQLENQRYYGFTLFKYDATTENPLEGATFTLSGTSDSGTRFEREVTSDQNGIVSFAYLENGSYILQESAAPKNYEQDTKQYLVTISEKGAITIDGLKYDEEKEYFPFANERGKDGRIKVTKIWKDGLTGEEAENRTHPKVHITTGTLTNTTSSTTGESTAKETAANAAITEEQPKSLLQKAVGLVTNLFVVTVYAADDDIASGVDGTVAWRITGEGELILEPAGGETGMIAQTRTNNAYPWTDKDVRDKITKVTVKEEVQTGANAKAMFSNLQKCTTMDLSGLNTAGASDFSSMFYNCRALENITFGDQWDTSTVKNFGAMFYSCRKLASLDLEKFNTSSATSMNQMFYYCSSLSSLDVRKFDTSNVTNLALMFYRCSSLDEIDVTGFDTSKATDMSSMFSGCSSLKELDVTNFKTSKVTRMPFMFKECSSLEELDVSKFNTSNVRTMESMFESCSGLDSLDLKNFDTSKVTSMESMFKSCSGLSTIDVTKFDTSRVTNMSSMFSYSGIKNLDLKNFDTSKVTTMYNLFSHCPELESLDLTSFNTSKVTDMESMIRNCKKLTSVKLDKEKFDTSSVITMQYMFTDSSALTELDLSGFDTTSLTNMRMMFTGCSGLTTLNLKGPKFKISNVTTTQQMFSGCTNLEKLDLSNFDTSNVTDMASMFSSCKSLQKLDLSNFDISKLTSANSMNYMFYECRSLEELNISSFNITGSAVKMQNILNGCYALNKLGLGENSIFKTTARVPAVLQTWTRFATFANMRLFNEDPVSIYKADGFEPGWYTRDLSKINLSDYDVEYISEEGDHKDIPWVYESDNTWTYTFNVFDDTEVYRVYEETLTGYNSDTYQITYQTINGADGTNVKSATITNTKEGYEEPKTGSVTLSKTVTGDGVTAEDQNKAFAFTVTFSGMTGVQILSGTIFKDGVGTVYLKHGESVTFSELPEGTTYTVTEAEDPNFTAASEGENGTISSTKISEAKFTNTKVPEDKTKVTNGFKMKKELSGNAVEKTDEFTFYINFTKLEKNQTYTFDNGVNVTADEAGLALAVITLKDGEVVSIEGLPEKATYKITEEASDYQASYQITDASENPNVRNIEQNVKINQESNEDLSTKDEIVQDKEDITVTFTNTRNILTTDFSFLKLAEDTKAALSEVRFNLSGMADDGTDVNEVAVSDETGLVTFKELPIGTYELKELEAPEGYSAISGYTVTVVQNDDGTISAELLDDNGNVVTKDETTNYLQILDPVVKGTLQVHKVLKGGTMNGNFDGFVFHAELKDSTGAAMTGKVTVRKYLTESALKYDEKELVLDEGKVSFTLNDGEYLEFINLPYGTSYLVTEESENFYESEVTKGSEKGSIKSDRVQSVTFTNTLNSDIIMPETGANRGRYLFYFGSASILLGGLYFEESRRRKKKAVKK